MAVGEEVAGRLNIAHAHGLLDITQLYDSAGWHHIRAAAMRLGFPPGVLGLELQPIHGYKM
eukprot:3515365-Pyramimonas_sp.AAC.1